MVVDRLPVVLGDVYVVCSLSVSQRWTTGPHTRLTPRAPRPTNQHCDASACCRFCILSTIFFCFCYIFVRVTTWLTLSVIPRHTEHCPPPQKKQKKTQKRSQVEVRTRTARRVDGCLHDDDWRAAVTGGCHDGTGVTTWRLCVTVTHCARRFGASVRELDSCMLLHDLPLPPRSRARAPRWLYCTDVPLPRYDSWEGAPRCRA